MNISSPTCDHPDSPALPIEARDSTRFFASGSVTLSFRPFGSIPEHLEINFAANDRPRLVTEILSACLLGKNDLPLTSEQVWNLTVSGRIECLLQLVAENRGFTGRVALRCPHNECRQTLEVDLPVAGILALQRSAEERDMLEWQDGPDLLRLRRPTGGDQLKWQQTAFTDVADARTALLHTLIVPDESNHHSAGTNSAGRRMPELIDSLETRLEEFDPMVAFSVRVRCPHCGSETDFPVDLEGFALAELEKIQRQLFQMIHCLASFYHWSESEIFCLTPERRRRYLELIREENS